MNSATSAIDAITRSFDPEGLRPPFPLASFVRAFGGRDVASALSGVSTWQEVSPSVFQGATGDTLGGYLGFLEDEMFRAYVPAWMVHVLDKGAEADPDALAAVLVSLDPGLSRRMWKQDRFETRKLAMTPAERRAVAAFGEAIAGDPALTRANGYDAGPVIAAAWTD